MRKDNKQQTNQKEEAFVQEKCLEPIMTRAATGMLFQYLQSFNTYQFFEVPFSCVHIQLESITIELIDVIQPPAITVRYPATGPQQL